MLYTDIVYCIPGSALYSQIYAGFCPKCIHLLSIKYLYFNIRQNGKKRIKILLLQNINITCLNGFLNVKTLKSNYLNHKTLKLFKPKFLTICTTVLIVSEIYKIKSCGPNIIPQFDYRSSYFKKTIVRGLTLFSPIYKFC